MTDKMKDLAERVACSQIRVSALALVCLLVIAIVAMSRLPDPENLLINIVLVISGIVGVGIGSASPNKRQTDQPPKE
jgi:hypothetical protein